jgi:hypothetical protein
MVHWNPQISEGVFSSITSKEISTNILHLFCSTIAENFSLVEINLKTR